MSNKLFTEQEQGLLRKNPYVKNVSSKSITYTEEFREFFVNMYNLSKKPTEIFIIAGFDPKNLLQNSVVFVLLIFTFIYILLNFC